jgi:two-component system, sensor histidine kinase
LDRAQSTYPLDEAAYLAAGMDGVAQEPVDPESLLQAIRAVLTPSDALADAA